MTVQTAAHHAHHVSIERLASGARRLVSRLDRIAYRSQLGPTRDSERYDFRPARRR